MQATLKSSDLHNSATSAATVSAVSRSYQNWLRFQFSFTSFTSESLPIFPAAPFSLSSSTVHNWFRSVRNSFRASRACSEINYQKLRLKCINELYQRINFYQWTHINLYMQKKNQRMLKNLMMMTDELD
ncbi:unnamed protein product [Rhodiola kirilowii]